MVLNLNQAKRMMESVMSDLVLIRRGNHQASVFDSQTGTYLPDPAETLYLGSGFLIPITAALATRAAEQSVWVQTINLWLPLDSPEALLGDLIVCLASERAPELRAVEWEVDYSEVGSFSVARKVVAHRDLP